MGKDRRIFSSASFQLHHQVFANVKEDWKSELCLETQHLICNISFQALLSLWRRQSFAQEESRIISHN